MQKNHWIQNKKVQHKFSPFLCKTNDYEQVKREERVKLFSINKISTINLSKLQKKIHCIHNKKPKAEYLC